MKKIHLLVFSFMVSASAYAQTKADSLQPVLVQKINQASSWLSRNGFQVRRSFDGSKEEAKPAAIAWNSDYENKKFYTLIDVGIKLTELEVLPNSEQVALLFYPKAEWHRNTINDDAKKKNNLMGGINTEFFWLIADHWYTRPLITASFDYKKDFVKDIKTTQTKGYLTFNGSKDGEPGAPVRNRTKAVVFKYFPYTGLEHYRNIGTSGQKASMWSNRLYFELYPLSSYQYQYIQLTFDYTCRKVFNDSLYNQGDMSWFSLGLNFFPGGNEKLGLGLDYSQGEDPSSNFVKTKLLALGIKLKI